MTDANVVMSDALSSSARDMSEDLPSPSPQQCRLSLGPRRTSSAPNLRSFSNLGSSVSSDEPPSSGSSSSSRTSYSHREWRPHEFRLPRPAPADNDRAQSPGSPRSPIEPAVPASSTEATAERITENMELMTRRLEEIRRNLSRRQRRSSRLTWRNAYIAAAGFFGYGPEGTASRKEIVSLTGKLLFGAGQIGATIALLIIGAHTKSPADDTLNEWEACDRPLGVWSSLWCVRVALGCLMAIWGYRRKMRHLADVAQRIGNTEPTDRQPPHLAPTDSTASPVRRHRHGHSSNAGLNRQISSVTFARLTTLLSLLSLTWFITAHILTYTSIHTCRLSAPHLWWLTFGIICIGYLVIVEVIVVALLVFIVGPLIFLLLNVILICMGRNPIRHPNHLHPEVGKLSPKAVDRIPLVLYIPAPTPKATPTIITPPEDSSPLSAPQIAVPEPAHVHAYPPEPERPNLSPTSTSGTRVQSRSRRLFTFRRIRKGHKGDAEKGKEKLAGTPDEEQGYSYEDKWEKGEYPFVKLEDNRAACAICLSDFEEPKRIRYSMDSKPPEDLDQAEKGLGSDLVVPEMEGEGDGGLRLTEAGEGAQPLRLLACAHVFHKTCLDPWLTEMSGRCPVCQRAVEVSESSNGGRASRRR